MTVQLEGISRLDNDVEYVNFVSLAIKLADPDSSVEIRKSSGKINVTVKPSTSEFKQSIIDCSLEANRRLGLVIRFSKSLALQKYVSFILELPE